MMFDEDKDDDQDDGSSGVTPWLQSLGGGKIYWIFGFFPPNWRVEDVGPIMGGGQKRD